MATAALLSSAIGSIIGADASRRHGGRRSRQRSGYRGAQRSLLQQKADGMANWLFRGCAVPSVQCRLQADAEPAPSTARLLRLFEFSRAPRMRISSARGCSIPRTARSPTTGMTQQDAERRVVETHAQMQAKLRQRPLRRRRRLTPRGRHHLRRVVVIHLVAHRRVRSELAATLAADNAIMIDQTCSEKKCVRYCCFSLVPIPIIIRSPSSRIEE